MEFIVDDMQDGYISLVRHVAAMGEVVSPRGVKTYEVVNASIQLTTPARSLPVDTGRALNTKIAAVEALQLIGGVIDPAAMLRASGAFSSFMDGGTFHGGYGQRTRAQVPAAVERLIADPDTRRAVITMWDPQHDLFTQGMKDYPCTIALQFLVRNHELQLHTHMRSNDVWRGLAYDVFVFTQLQLAVAASLGIPAGGYFHHVTSLHLYVDDIIDVANLRDAPTTSSFPSLFTEHLSLERCQEIARGLLAHDTSIATHEVNEEMLAWYVQRV